MKTKKDILKIFKKDKVYTFGDLCREIDEETYKKPLKLHLDRLVKQKYILLKNGKYRTNNELNEAIIDYMYNNPENTSQILYDNFVSDKIKTKAIEDLELRTLGVN